MKKILLILLLIFGLFSCNIHFPDNPSIKRPEYIENSDLFFVSTRAVEDEVAVSWICKLMNEDIPLSWGKGHKKYSDLKFDLFYSTRYSTLPGNAKIKTLLEPTLAGNIKSPYSVTGLESGMIYYFQLRAVVDGENVAVSTVFEAKVP